MADKSIMSYETVALDEENHALVIIDQTKLPGQVKMLHLTEQKDIWQAIYLLQVRGAPAIGVAAAWGCCLARYASCQPAPAFACRTWAGIRCAACVLHR